MSYWNYNMIFHRHQSSRTRLAIILHQSVYRGCSLADTQYNEVAIIDGTMNPAAAQADADDEGGFSNWSNDPERQQQRNAAVASHQGASPRARGRPDGASNGQATQRQRVPAPPPQEEEEREYWQD